MDGRCLDLRHRLGEVTLGPGAVIELHAADAAVRIVEARAQLDVGARIDLGRRAVLEDDGLLRGLLFRDAGAALGLPLGARLREEVAKARRLLGGDLVVRLLDEEAAHRVLGLVLAAERDVVEREEAVDLDLLRLRVAGAEQRRGERLDRLLVLLLVELRLALLDQVDGLTGLAGLGGLRLERTDHRALLRRLRLRLRERRRGQHDHVQARHQRDPRSEPLHGRRGYDSRAATSRTRIGARRPHRPPCARPARTTRAGRAPRRAPRAGRRSRAGFSGPPRGPSP